MFRMLSMDGGPATFTTLRLLRWIEKDSPGFLDRTSLFCGTSDGGVAALFFAYKLAGAWSGADSPALIREAIELVDAIMVTLRPKDEHYIRLFSGRKSMYEFDALAQVLKQFFGEEATVGDLARDVVVVTGRAHAPWGPEVYTNHRSSRHDHRLLWEIALETCSFPVVFPLQGGHVDGALYMNNPAMVALTEVLAHRRMTGLTLDDLVLLSLGSDAGTSILSNQHTPWNAGSISPPEVPDDLTDEQRELLEAVDQEIVDFHAFLQSDDSPLQKLEISYDGEPVYPREVGANSEAEGSAPWGYIPWLLWPKSLIFLLQVYINNQGIGVSRQCAQLMGNSAFRLAPAGQLATNMAFAAILLRWGGLVRRHSELTALLWFGCGASWPHFSPTVGEFKKWADAHWWPSPPP